MNINNDDFYIFIQGHTRNIEKTFWQKFMKFPVYKFRLFTSKRGFIADYQIRVSERLHLYLIIYS